MDPAPNRGLDTHTAHLPASRAQWPWPKERGATEGADICGCNVASSWQRPPQQTTKNCIAIFTRNLFCGNIAKVFERGTDSHVGDIWPNCSLIYVHTEPCGCAAGSIWWLCRGASQMGNVNTASCFYLVALCVDFWLFHILFNSRIHRKHTWELGAL